MKKEVSEVGKIFCRDTEGEMESKDLSPVSRLLRVL
jgi:hypothetical protein